MASYSKAKLSGSTDGKPIPVAATSTPGTTIHTAGASGLDEIYLWAVNTDSSAVTLTIEWGGTSSPGDLALKTYTIPPLSALIPIITGHVLGNSLVVKAFASSASTINLMGFVNQIR